MPGKRIALSGVGGTGKTSVLAEVLRLVPDAVAMPSISRRYYEIAGVQDEKAFWANTDAAARLEFQLGMLRYYLEAYREADERAGDRPLICDRSIYDHAAFTIYANPQLDRNRLGEIIELTSTVRSVRIVRFSYPVPWEIEDGFRDVRVGKNFAIHGITTYLVERFARFHMNLSMVSVELRALEIVRHWGLNR